MKKLLGFVLIILITGGIIMAQAPVTTDQTGTNVVDPNKEEIDNLNHEKLKAETKKAIADLDKAEAEAKAAARKTKWDISNSEGLKGTVTLKDSAGYYAELLAYKAVEAIAQEISKIPDNALKDDSLIILGNVDLTIEAALWNLLDLKLNISIKLIDDAIKIYPPMVQSYTQESLGVIGVLTVAPEILGAVADIAAFFKTNHTISGRDIVLNEKALKAAVAHHLSNTEKNLTILLPEYDLTGSVSLYDKVYQLNKKLEALMGVRDSLTSGLDKKIKQNYGNLTALKINRDALDKKIIDSSLKAEELEKLKDELAKLDADIWNLSVNERAKAEIIPQLEKDILAGHELVNTLTKRSDTTPSPIENTKTIDFIHKYSDAKIMYLIIASQGGEVETAESKYSQGRVSYLGGAVVTLFLTKSNGEYIYSNNIQQVKTASYKRKDGTGSLLKNHK